MTVVMGGDPPNVPFHHAPSRSKAHPLNFLAGCRDRILECDACQSLNAMIENAPIAAEMLPQIALLCQVEQHMRGKEASMCLAARCEFSALIIAALKP